MRNDNDKIKILSIGIFSLAAAYAFYFFLPASFIPGINDTSYWYSYLFSRSAVRSVNVVGVVVDDQSIHKIANRWPLSRSVYAELIKKLEAEKVHTIGFDFVFEGASENPADDIIFKQALDSVTAGKISRVVLGLTLNEGKSADEKTKTVFTLLSKDFKEAAYAAGMVNTPYDQDGTIRRLRGYVDIGNGERYYSLSVQLASSYLNRSPEDVVKKLPLRFDKTFLINYLLKPSDVIRVSLYDVLNNMDDLKRAYGAEFLKNSLVLVYPEAEITHDSAHTPLGTMPGGLLHINGAVDIITGKVFREVPFLGFVAEAGVFAGIFYILRYYGLITGFLFTLGILFVNFWGLLVCRLFGVTFDLSRVIVFSALFFLSGSLFKYLLFLTQLLKIKDKATRDPLRGIFTLRYFFYRLEFELKKFYFSQDPYLVFFRFNSFSENMGADSGNTVKSVWQKIKPLLNLKESFWALYSHNELAGCIVSRKNKVASCVRSLKNNLEMVFHQEQGRVSVSVVCVKLRREYSIKELLFVLSKEAVKNSDEIVFLKATDVSALIGSGNTNDGDTGDFLSGLDDDIEEKNRQLLSLIDNLNKEHEKAQYAFFQIITALANAVEARDPYTEGHSERVCSYSLMLADALGWSSEQKEKLRKAAMLHDLGKIGIPDNVLHKKDKLNDEEYDFIKKHTVISVRILEPLKELKEIVPWIMYHHERWDGRGYPHGLGGNSIPVAAQIIAIADTFDAITTGRDYKNALTYELALLELEKAKGGQFNPQLVDTFLKLIREYYRDKEISS